MTKGSFIQEDKFLDFDFDIETRIREPLITVQLTEMKTGLRARASAKRNEPDRFSVETGRTLALARALGRFARRLERQTIRDLECCP